MNQNYNSLLSPNKNIHKLDFQNSTCKPPQKEALFDQIAPKPYEKVIKLNRETIVKEI